MNAENSNGPRPLVAGNWKMNGTKASLEELKVMAAACDSALTQKLDVLVCPPATLVDAAVSASGGKLAIGGQDCHMKASGAHTGDIAAQMLADLGARYCIVGHSERRADHGESSETVASKAAAAIGAGLTAIICVGETREQRESGSTLEVIGSQLTGSIPAEADAANMVIAYEPVWAIGTGLTPTPADVAEVHAFIREALNAELGAGGAAVRILYGGSVKPENAAELMAVGNVNGALVGGASLKASDFMGIAAVYR